MSSKISFPDKECLFCKKTFNRKTLPSGRLEASTDFRVRKFCCHRCYSDYNQGRNHYLYLPEGSIRYDGYVRIAVNGKREYLHRHVMEKFLGRKLLEDEHVHHIDGNTGNNDINNLKLTTNSEHLKMHYKERKINEKGQFV